MSAPWDPFKEFERLFDQAFDDFFGESGNRPGALNSVHRYSLPFHRWGNGDGASQSPSRRPRMDLHENRENNTVTASFEFPGVKKEDVSIDLHNGVLNVCAESKKSNDLSENGYALRERAFGRLCRCLQLPQGVAEKDVKASMENGLLTVTFPGVAAANAPKKISIA